MENIAIIAAAAVGGLLLLINLFFYKRIRHLEKTFIEDNGKEGNLELKSKILAKDVKRLDKDIHDLYEINSKLNKVAKRGVCKIGFERFNSFNEKGGLKSFAIALMDYKDNGVIISTLQNSDKARLYIRPVKKGESKATLTPEEKKALIKAKQVVFK